MPWENNINLAPNPIENNRSKSDANIFYNRADAVRRDTDKVKNVSIKLIDIDTTIVNYMKDTLKLQVMDNGEVVNVPIIYGNPERWLAVQKDGYLRDNQGKILLPAIMVSRKTVENNKDLKTFNEFLSYQTVMKYTEKNKYDRFDLLNPGLFKSRPTKQIFAVTLPDPIIITYECMIWTDYVDQNNTILEQINFAEKSYWGDSERLKFRARIDSYSTEQEINEGEDRNVRTTFDLMVNGYLLPEFGINSQGGYRNTTQKLFTVRKIKLSESVGDISGNSLNMPDTLTDLKDNPTDYNVTPVGVELKPNDKKDDSGYNKLATPKKTVNSIFHPAPRTLKDYGEIGWLAHDKNRIYVYNYPTGWLYRDIATFDYDYSSETYISGYDCNGNPIYTTRNRRPINTAFRVFARFPDKFYHQVPYQSSDYGEDGWMSFDGNWFYIYGSGEWRRVPISLFDPL